MTENKDEFEVNEDEFEVTGSTDSPSSNVLEKGRYPFEVISIDHHTAVSSGNKSAKVILMVEGLRIRDFLPFEGVMVWKWKQFLFSIGIRDKRKKFIVKKELIVGKKGLVDVGVKDSTYNDGTIMKENMVRSYSPIKEEVAPIKGVEPEYESENTAKEEQDKPKADEKTEGQKETKESAEGKAKELIDDAVVKTKEKKKDKTPFDKEPKKETSEDDIEDL